MVNSKNKYVYAVFSYRGYCYHQESILHGIYESESVAEEVYDIILDYYRLGKSAKNREETKSMYRIREFDGPIRVTLEILGVESRQSGGGCIRLIEEIIERDYTFC